MTRRKRAKVAVLFDSYGSYQETCLQQIRSVLEPEGIAVVTVIGRELKPAEVYYEGVNHIYDLVRNADFKGFIIGSASLSHNVTKEELTTFVKSFASVPVVSLGIALEGIASVVPDNRPGMTALMNHLLEGRGYRRFAFMRGFENNVDSLEREAAMREALAARGLGLEPELVMRGNFLTQDAFFAMDKLLEQRRDIEVVVAANDAMARGIIHALNKHDLTVPYDVAVVGFDDDLLSRSFMPPLTTVRQPLAYQAKVAAEQVLRQLEQHPYKAKVSVATELVVRRSCGSQPTR